MALILASGETLVSVASYTPPTQGTVCLWLKPNALVGLQRPIGLNDGWEIRIDGSTFWSDFWKTGMTDMSTSIDTSLQHFVCTRSSSNAANLYRNGTIQATSSTYTTASPGSGTLSIGTRTGGTDYYAGLIDDFRVYDRVLSAGEVATIFAAEGADDIVDGLTLRLLFDEGPVGTVIAGAGSVKDISTNGFNFSPGTNAPDYGYSILKQRRVEKGTYS